MKYFGFLAKFVVLPLAIFTFLNWRAHKRGRSVPDELRGVPAEAALAGLVGVAVAYTTPWDNYLVATRVWWYDPKLVVGRIGYVPIEEYSFFVLQTLMTGVWTVLLSRFTPHDEKPPQNGWRARIGLTTAIAGVWVWSVYNLFRGPRKRTYLSLMLSWALLPIMFQTLFGGDILWQHRRLIALGVIPTTLYLGLSDSLAIDSGTWTINPEKSVDYLIGGKLPLEEGLFFFLTNLLVTVGITLVMAKESQRRVPPFIRRGLGLKEVDEDRGI
ncbi:lycopene cyclase domain-containing protein [Anaerolineae bacterium CFX9]|nr:lycopene cyclase domain-containing protein [Anaerolineae bacterium CFX9]